MNKYIEDYPAHREEIITALNKTSKPYFVDVEKMTYAEWLERFVELAHPFATRVPAASCRPFRSTCMC